MATSFMFNISIFVWCSDSFIYKLDLQIYSCSYQGEICLMDVEKENFNVIHLCDYPIFSLCQAPNSPSSLYFAEGNDLKLYDERTGNAKDTPTMSGNVSDLSQYKPIR